MKGKLVKPQTLKGFRDFLPQEAKKRQYIINALKEVFELYGFEPLETPVLEYEDVLLGKYGQEGDKLMYRFTDKGDRNVAMRYDQTVPLARIVAQYQDLQLPFKRYQIQPVWRAEKPQKARYREFLQCDIDIVGSKNELADVEILACVSKACEQLGLAAFKVLVNDRSVFEGLPTSAITIIDKLNKAGEEKVREELQKRGFQAQLLDQIKKKPATDTINRVLSLLDAAGIIKEKIVFEPTLARGLDYYTGLIFEIEIEGYSGGSVGGGGRYDNLIGIFAGKQVPAIGFAFGFDRLYEALEEQNLFPRKLNDSTSKTLVTVFPGYENQSFQIASQLRNSGINCEVYLDEANVAKQLKYADKKNIPYAIFVGPDEIKKERVKLRDMKSGKEEELTKEELLKKVVNL